MTSDDTELDDEATVDVGGILPDLAVSAGGPMILAGRYVLLGMIGGGGMGTVYRARDLELGEIVAVKMLRRELSQNATYVARFRQEVKLARRVTHRNVARTFDIGEHGGDRFLTMEYVEGEALSDRMLRTGRFGLGEALDIAGSVCAGLAAAHAAGVVHRDLKPENILLARENRVVLTDFGVAIPLEEDEGDTVVDGGAGLIGTPIYMAPEQVDGSDVDLRADLYALGAILFEMLTGERPWKGDTVWAVASARLSQPPPDPRYHVPELPESLTRALEKLMARHPYDRFANAVDVLSELATITVPSSPGSMRGSRMSLPSIPDLPLDASSKSVAVLGFVPQGEKDDAWAAGVAVVIADRLRSIEGLRVLTPDSPPSSERDVRAIGQRVGAHAVVDGVLQRKNGRVTLGARLTAVVDGFQLWASRVERAEGDVLELANELVHGVAQALTVERGLKPERALTDRRAVNAYLGARAAVADDPAHAAELLTEALAFAPDDPLVLATLSSAELASALSAEPIDMPVAERALAHARAALGHAQDLAEARYVVARGAVLDGRAVDGARDLKHALRLSPGTAAIQALYGALLVSVGRPRQGLTCLEQALAFEPGLEVADVARIRARALLDDFEPFEKLAAGALPTTSSGLLDVARVAAWHRDPGWARSLEPVLAMHRAAPRGALARALTRVKISGEPTPELDATVHTAIAAAESREAREAALLASAEARALAGDHDGAILLIETASQEGLADLVWIERCPVLAPLSSRLADVHREVMRRAESVRLSLRG